LPASIVIAIVREMKFAQLLLCILVVTTPVLARGELSGSKSDLLRLVLIDDKTEKRLGPFPYDRSIIAQAIRACRKQEVKGVILKYFFDQPKSTSGDEELAQALKTLPVLLQARLDPDETHPNPLPNAAIFPGFQGKGDKLLGADSGWLPLPALARTAWGLGFADMRGEREVLLVPMVERYRGKPVRSLTLAALQLIFGGTPVVVEGKRLDYNGKSLPLNTYSEARIELPSTDDSSPISFADLIDGKVNQLKGRYVVLGYEGSQDPKFNTSIGRIGAHRLFFYGLRYLYRQQL
jgi:hypothetical protein